MENLKLRKFPLFNRYGDKRFLTEIEPHIFKLCGDLDYLRIISTDDGKGIYAIDPPGGPFIQINSFIKKDLYVKCIDFDKNTGDYLIHTEN